MTAFCREQGISRESFYLIRRRAAAGDVFGVLEPRSRRPKTSPTATSGEVVARITAVFNALTEYGTYAGPISVMDKMADLGMDPPSRATIARVLAAQGLSAVQPKKKPRSASKRFTYPAPNCLWQSDATEWHLADGSTCVIFQLVDDHSRYAVASVVGRSETAATANLLLRKGIAARGIPQKFLSDNGSAFNPARRRFIGGLMRFLLPLGVVMITGKPGHPQTQGKNERFHSTLFLWLSARPDATTLDELQALVDEFDVFYNNRRHQGLPGRITPQQAWDATPPVNPPDPVADPEPLIASVLRDPFGQGWRTANRGGIVKVHGTAYMLGKEHAGARIHTIWTPTTVAFYNESGTHITDHDRPLHPHGYVGNGKPRGFHTPEVSEMS